MGRRNFLARRSPPPPSVLPLSPTPHVSLSVDHLSCIHLLITVDGTQEPPDTLEEEHLLLTILDLLLQRERLLLCQLGLLEPHCLCVCMCVCVGGGGGYRERVCVCVRERE